MHTRKGLFLTDTMIHFPPDHSSADPRGGNRFKAIAFLATAALLLAPASYGPALQAEESTEEPRETEAEQAVAIVTNLGQFTIRLRPDVAPKTVENFLNYVESGAFDGTIFHRSVPDFVIQAGGYSITKDEEDQLTPVNVPTDPPVENEFNLSNIRGTVAMAKQGGDPDSATSQWFVNIGDNSENLDEQNGGFTVFAEVIGNGMAVADAINSLAPQEIGGAPFDSVPLIGLEAEDPLGLDNFVTIHSAVPFELRYMDSDDRTGMSFWLGPLDDEHFGHDSGWVLHDEHGWLYATGTGFTRGIWMWDDIQRDWFWTKHDVYPFLYRHNGGNGYWLYYWEGGTPEARDFYDYRESAWTRVPAESSENS